MKTIFYISIFSLLVISGTVTAETESEPIKCYQKAWGSGENSGLSLNVGQAVTLCSGATDANKVIQCYVQAWGHPSNGGLGLTVGQAISLCKTNLLQ